METIIGVALRDRAGTMHALGRPNRHHDVIRWMSSTGNGDLVHDAVQGFMTDQARFVTRTEALALATACGQVIEHSRPVPGISELFSEDLW